MSDNILDNFATLTAIRHPANPELLRALVETAAADGHNVFGATHLITKRGQIAGYMSLGMIPTVHTWFSTKLLKASDSLLTIKAAENQLALTSVPGVIIPVSPDSPFHPVMERMGYKKLYSADLFIKEF